MVSPPYSSSFRELFEDSLQTDEVGPLTSARPRSAKGQNVFLFDGIKKDVNDKEFYYEEFCYKQFNVKQHEENGEPSPRSLLPLDTDLQ